MDLYAGASGGEDRGRPPEARALEGADDPAYVERMVPDARAGAGRLRADAITARRGVAGRC